METPRARLVVKKARTCAATFICDKRISSAQIEKAVDEISAMSSQPSLTLLPQKTESTQALCYVLWASFELDGEAWMEIGDLLAKKLKVNMSVTF